MLRLFVISLLMFSSSILAHPGHGKHKQVVHVHPYVAQYVAVVKTPNKTVVVKQNVKEKVWVKGRWTKRSGYRVWIPGHWRIK